MSIKVFYERGECVVFSAQDSCGEDIREIVQRLEMVSRGCETSDLTLRRNGLGQLGFHPHEDGTPRRGCSELYRIPMVEYKLDSEGTPCEYKTPFRRNTTWHRVPPPSGQALARGSTPHPGVRASAVPTAPPGTGAHSPQHLLRQEAPGRAQVRSSLLLYS
ncbi:hypothetical protein SKAU_G00304000 [Synaphobranchus kaupii]|uniref:Uncharacterized protein n=1 Tax=Synaphobranchus kaupii TaxID=118154 RepID=A0A9Q1EW71_SYNKA|nr:hypothetical protein SKAU_G00304000 [Synaphobranchus kaupii]